MTYRVKSLKKLHEREAVTRVLPGPSRVASRFVFTDSPRDYLPMPSASFLPPSLAAAGSRTPFWWKGSGND